MTIKLKLLITMILTNLKFKMMHPFLEGAPFFLLFN